MSHFDYLGEKFERAEEFPAFAYAEFCEALADGAEENSQQATGVALRLAVACVADKDRQRFRAVSRAKNAKVEDWLKVFYNWSAAEADRPTGQPTGSSAGPEATPENSEPQPVASVTSLPDPVQNPRPDLALAISRSA